MTENDHLEHYASPYYDPVKAHEYYMEHRKLKGRKKSALSDEGKRVWEYTESQIKSEKSATIEEAKKEQDESIEELRTQADETRERISKKLKELQEKLAAHDRERKAEIAEEAKAEKERIAEEKERKIESVRKETTPVGASSSWKAKLNANRKAKIASIRKEAQQDAASVSEDAAKKKTSVSEETKTERTKNSEDAAAERKEVGTSLKAAVQAAREAYQLRKTEIDTNYEEIFQREYDKIAEEYPYVKKAKSKSGKKSSSKKIDKSSGHNFQSYTKEERRKLIRDYQSTKTT